LPSLSVTFLRRCGKIATKKVGLVKQIFAITAEWVAR
jgi:hypothetical protein